MTRLIDADKLKFTIAPIAPVLVGDEVHWETIILKDRIDSAPTVDAVPVVHGRWKCISVGRYACSLCGFEPWYEGSVSTLHYCPNCSARMDKE